MDENIKSDNNERVSLFSSIGCLFSKLFSKLRKQISDFLAVTSQPLENVPKNGPGKGTAKVQRKKPIGLFTIIGLVGKAAQIILKATWKYGIKPIMQSQKTIDERNPKKQDPTEVQKKDVCPLIRTIGKPEKKFILQSPVVKEHWNVNLKPAKKEEHTNRPNSGKIKI